MFGKPRLSAAIMRVERIGIRIWHLVDRLNDNQRRPHSIRMPGLGLGIHIPVSTAHPVPPNLRRAAYGYHF